MRKESKLAPETEGKERQGREVDAFAKAGGRFNRQGNFLTRLVLGITRQVDLPIYPPET